jgi:hypothetical protein
VSRDRPSGAGATSGELPESRGGADTRPASSRQQRDHHPHLSRAQEPLEPQPTPRPRHAPDPLLVSPPPRLHRLASTVQPSPLTHLIPCPPALPDPRSLPPPRLRPLQLPAWAGPSRFYLDSRGRGVRREAADSPSSKAQAGSQGNTRRRGGGLLRSWEKPIERNRWRETQGGKQASRRRQLPLPGAGFAAARPLHQGWGGRARSGGWPGPRPAPARGRAPQYASDTPPEHRECSSHGNPTPWEARSAGWCECRDRARNRKLGQRRSDPNEPATRRRLTCLGHAVARQPGVPSNVRRFRGNRTVRPVHVSS